MGKYRSRVNLKLKDGRKVSPVTGVFECSDAEAASLLENNWIVPANTPIVSGIAEETINLQANEIKTLKKQIEDQETQILTLQNIINVKEADIDRLNKIAAEKTGGKTK